MTEEAVPEVTITDISPEKTVVIQEAMSKLKGKGFVPTITSFSIDPTLGEGVRGKYVGGPIVFRSEGHITPFLVEHELLHGVIAEARESIGDDFLIDYAEIAGFTGKGLAEAIKVEATVRTPIVEDLVRMMQSYLRGADLPSAYKSFYDNLSKTIAKPPAMSVVEYDRRYTLEELREEARQAGLSSSGSKKEIAAKLIARGVT